ncbi:hypothetical protein [Gimesia chilikensis]|uniref:hypothetical protein n=1 Tax=Gimesia chilikensis TaxID=2605989 RepID=UPI003A919D16
MKHLTLVVDGELNVDNLSVECGAAAQAMMRVSRGCGGYFSARSEPENGSTFLHRKSTGYAQNGHQQPEEFEMEFFI